VRETANLFHLQRGQSVEVHSKGYPPYVGLVEESMPGLNVVWIRNPRTGERRMLLASEHDIYRC
jgi:hypothetical protein